MGALCARWFDSENRERSELNTQHLNTMRPIEGVRPNKAIFLYTLPIAYGAIRYETT